MVNLNGCNFTDFTVQTTDTLYYIVFYVLLPYHLTLGPLLNILLITTLAKLVKEKSIFVYQLLVVCARLFDNVFHGSYLAGAFWWAGAGGYVAPWFGQSYTLMFIVMRLLPTPAFIGIYLPLFASVAMAGDRVFALRRPIAYSKINRGLHVRVAIVACCVLSLALSADKYWTYTIIETKGSGNSTTAYGYTINSAFANSLLGQAIVSIRTYTRVGLVIVLIALNAIMIHLYRARMDRVKRMTISTEERIRARKEASKHLLILSVCQSVLTCLDQIPNAAGELLKVSSTYWAKCYVVLSPEYTGANVLASSIEIFVLMAVSRKIRMAVPGYRVVLAVRSKVTGTTLVNPSKVSHHRGESRNRMSMASEGSRRA